MDNVTSEYGMPSFNESSESEWQKYSNIMLPLRYLRMCLGIGTTVTNGLFLLTYICRPIVRKNIRLFVVNLAIVDLQNGCLILPLLAAFPRTPDGFKTTPALCTFISDWSMALFCVAHLSHLLVTVDRFISICKPLRHQMILNNKICLMLIGIIWISGIAFAFWPSFGLPRQPGIPYSISCGGAVAVSVTYLFVFIYGVLAIPLIADVVMYIYIFSIAKRHAGAIAQLATLGANTEQDQRIKRAQSKAIRTTVMGTGFFLLSWLPFLLLFNVITLCSHIYRCAQINRGILGILILIFTTMAYSNSMINPLLFALRDKMMRESTMRLFCPCIVARELRRIGVMHVTRDLRERTANL